MNKENPLKLSWREVIDGSNIPFHFEVDKSKWPKVWFNHIRSSVQSVGYKYVAIGGIVYDLDHKEICTVYDLVPR